MKRIILILILFCFSNTNIEALPKVLHVSFHIGCIKEIESVGRQIGLDITSWYVLKNKETHDKLDPITSGWNAIYNVGHDRAARIWKLNKDYFEQFDAIITSDTAPLSRIFLQNGWKKPLIIWICNRFDYSDCDRDCVFPDAEYYELMRKARHMPNVKVVNYVAYEYVYARSMGVDTGNLVIKPCGFIESTLREGDKSMVPAHIKKEETFFIPPRLADHQIVHLLNICKHLGINAYCGKYNGPCDLKNFKGVIHFPYQWSNLALFENMQLGLVHFIPSKKFAWELSQSREANMYRFFTFTNLEYSEWYSGENGPAIICFDSWQDLVHKINHTDFAALRNKIQEFGGRHHQTMIGRWKQVFNELFS